MYLVFDFETYSEANLSEVGAYEYSAHPSTKVLCAAWQLLDNNRKTCDLPKFSACWRGESLTRLKTLLAMPGMIGVAHNLMFELAICKNVLGWDFEIENWEDTAVLASAYGLPRSLEKAALALNLTQQKDASGKRLITLLSKPTTKKITENDYEELLTYCIQDVTTQTELFQRVPFLHEVDRSYWLANMRMNLRGFEIDRQFATFAETLLDKRYAVIDAEFQAITGISSATKTAATFNWLKKYGFTGPDLTKQTVENYQTSDAAINRVLDLRGQRSKSAVKKYSTMLLRSFSDGRARDTTIFYGAHTGRDAGVGLQPQNLAKSSSERWEVDYFMDMILASKCPPQEQIIQILSDCVRGCIKAKDGYKLVVADFAGIELRVLFWLAGHDAGLEAIRQGKDLYKEMAAYIYQIPVAKVTKDQRQLGKQVILGAGFGIGVNGEKFQAAAKSYGIDITLDVAQKAIRAYRKLHEPIPDMWKDLEMACVKAVLSPGKYYKCGFLTTHCEGPGKPLTIELPSGRKLYYQNPKVTKVQASYGEKYELSFVGVHGPAKKFERRKIWGGTLVENVVQAVARDVLYNSLVNLEDVVPVVLAVHDEGVGEVPLDFDAQIMQTIMETNPQWAPDLPINVEIWEGKRYGK